MKQTFIIKRIEFLNKHDQVAMTLYGLQKPEQKTRYQFLPLQTFLCFPSSQQVKLL